MTAVFEFHPACLPKSYRTLRVERAMWPLYHFRDFLEHVLWWSLDIVIYLEEACHCHQAQTTHRSVVPHSVIRAVRMDGCDIKVVAPMTLADSRGA